MENLLLGFTTATSLINLLWCFLGVLLGTLVGVLPGLGPMAAISLLLPMVYSTGDPIGGIIFLAGIYYGTQYGGSITSILLKLPGEASSTVTVIDGYAMTKNGRGGAALTITALASFIGGTVATLIIALLAKPLSNLAFLFGPADYASLMILGILACVSITQGSIIKGLVMVMLGTFLGLVGTDINSGHTRFTGGIIYLIDGITFAAMAIGIFGLGEILYNILKPSNSLKKPESINSLYPTAQEYRDSVAPTARGTLLGTLLGLLPGGGAVLSSFLSYAVERKVSKNIKEFGNGAVAGVAGPESANNASAQSQFLPTLMLGLPVTPIMALIVSVLIMNGIQPGPQVIERNPDLFWGLIVSMWLGNLILVILNIPLIRIWISVLYTPKWLLYSIVIILSILGAYSINNSWFDVLLLLLFGLLGLLLKIYQFEPAPLALSFIVAPMLEEYGRRALVISRNDYMVFLERPISLTFLSIAVTILLVSFIIKNKNLFK